MKMADLKPITFRSDEELAKSVETESKVFSVYATGVAESGRRKTIRRIHAVIDFRGAPLPPDPFGGKSSAPLSPEQVQAAIDKAQPKANTPDEFDAENGVANAFRPDPAGRVIYYRIQ
jgi:general secretion pathway protein K